MDLKFTHSRTWPDNPDSWENDRSVECNGVYVGNASYSAMNASGLHWQWSVLIHGVMPHSGYVMTKEEALEKVKAVVTKAATPEILEDLRRRHAEAEARRAYREARHKALVEGREPPARMKTSSTALRR